MFESRYDFFIYSLVGISKILSSLTVPDDYIFNPKRFEHQRGDFTGKSSIFFKMHILGAKFNIYMVRINNILHASKCYKRGTHTDFAIIFIFIFITQFLNKFNSFKMGHIHFPVACDKRFPHFNSPAKFLITR